MRTSLAPYEGRTLRFVGIYMGLYKKHQTVKVYHLYLDGGHYLCDHVFMMVFVEDFDKDNIRKGQAIRFEGTVYQYMTRHFDCKYPSWSIKDVTKVEILSYEVADLIKKHSRKGIRKNA